MSQGKLQQGHLGQALPRLPSTSEPTSPECATLLHLLQDFYKAGGRLPDGVWEEILLAVAEVEAAYGAKFADPADPLLFSVRSGAAVSMPVSALRAASVVPARQTCHAGDGPRQELPLLPC